MNAEQQIEKNIIDSTSEFFKILADNTRLHIINLLLDREMFVNDIANALNMTNSSISHQLKKMKDNDVVKSRKDGKEVYYSLNDDHVKSIFLTTIDHIKHSQEGK
ncbi:ArsR/SmtB family transcription factor [Helcococcus kunzii]|uniref:HTH arsR-type domain-containing protein n=1 Tax=Helcococcus kunzii ATCC 51366 TaxID=883114 RepID=H3NQK2_9FIRM|nr:metalloregulator ArsR/SmtB family transcription factor [Helcococcus kunzii]EHR32332.1 hypothetical protein HMPREF9709_01613 [Helcococcus kunzii ATCC 51366]